MSLDAEKGLSLNPINSSQLIQQEKGYMQIKNILVGMLLSICPGVSGIASALVINTSYNLGQGLNGVALLDDGSVNIANGDHVELRVNFLDNKALNIKAGGEYIIGWLYAGDNGSSFMIDNIEIEYLEC